MTGPALQAFTAGLAPEFSSIVTTLDETIHSAAPLDSAIKWRQLTYAVNGDYHHWICAINVTKKQVSLRFHFGGLLSDPEGVFRVGESKWMRSLIIYLEWQAFYEKCHLVIANKGKRPISIKRIIVKSPEDDWAGFTVLEDDEVSKLPSKLSYGDEVTYILNDEVAHRLWTQEFQLFVYDSEGNVYSPTKKRTYSPRYEGYSKFEKINYKKQTRGGNKSD